MTTPAQAERPIYPDPAIGMQIRDRRLSKPIVVRMSGVSKSFGTVDVLKGVSLNACAGEVLGLIGPSGCGKTTVVKLLVGLLSPDDGIVEVVDSAPTAFTSRDRRQIGYTPQGFILYPSLTVQQNARFVAGLYGMGWRHRRRRVREVLKFLELWEARNRLARDISGGMQRRLSLACALLHSPRILFVDEPTAGLDPVLRAKVWQHIQDLRDGGCTVFVTTQHMDEATYCDRIAVMREGSVLAIGTPDDLRKRAMQGDMIEVEAAHLSRADVVALWDLACVKRVDWRSTRHIWLAVDDSGTAVPDITEALHSRGVEVEAVRPCVPTFDEVFMNLVSDDE